VTTIAYLSFLKEEGIGPSPQFVPQPLLQAAYDAAKMEAIFVPMLYNLSGPEDLFVAIDLNERVDQAPALQIGDMLPVSDGESRELPGFLSSAEDFGLDRSSGFVSPGLLTGNVGVGGFYGLEVVPEPATILLLGHGLCPALIRRRR